MHLPLLRRCDTWGAESRLQKVTVCESLGNQALSMAKMQLLCQLSPFIYCGDCYQVGSLLLS